MGVDIVVCLSVCKFFVFGHPLAIYHGGDGGEDYFPPSAQMKFEMNKCDASEKILSLTSIYSCSVHGMPPNWREYKKH